MTTTFRTKSVRNAKTIREDMIAMGLITYVTGEFELARKLRALVPGAGSAPTTPADATAVEGQAVTKLQQVAGLHADMVAAGLVDAAVKPLAIAETLGIRADEDSDRTKREKAKAAPLPSRDVDGIIPFFQRFHFFFPRSLEIDHAFGEDEFIRCHNEKFTLVHDRFGREAAHAADYIADMDRKGRKFDTAITECGEQGVELTSTWVDGRFEHVWSDGAGQAVDTDPTVATVRLTIFNA